MIATSGIYKVVAERERERERMVSLGCPVCHYVVSTDTVSFSMQVPPPLPSPHPDSQPVLFLDIHIT